VSAFVEYREPTGYLLLEAFYISKGFSIRAERENEPVDEITPDMEVVIVHLWESRTFDELSIEIEHHGVSSLPLKGSQEWKGYGPIKVLNRE